MKETSSDNAAGTSRQSKRRRFTLRPSLVIAVLLAGLAAAWILSGQIEGHAPPATANAPSAEGQAAETTRARSPGAVAEGKAVAVRVYDSVARPQRAVLQITGRTEAERRVTLSAETEGRVTAVMSISATWSMRATRWSNWRPTTAWRSCARPRR